MSKISRRALLRGFVVTGGASVATAPGVASHAPQTQSLVGHVGWFNRSRAMLMVEVDGADAPRAVVELRGLSDAPIDVTNDLRPARQVSLILSPPVDAASLSPWRVDAIVLDCGERLAVEARLISLTWAAPDRTDDILQVVSRHFGVSTADIVSERRHRLVIRARQTGIYLCHKLTSHSLREIGRRFGNRDHTVVLHAIRKIDGRVTDDTRVREEVEALQQQVTRIAWKSPS